MDDRPLRILLASPAYWPARGFGGPVVAAREIVRRLVERGHTGTWRLGNTKLAEKILKTTPVLGQVDDLGTGTDKRHTAAIERFRQVDSRLTAELDNRWCNITITVLIFQDIAHAFFVQCLEVKPTAGIEIGGDRFGIGVDHDTPKTCLLQCPCRMDATVIELDTLPDTDRPAADHQCLAFRD